MKGERQPGQGPKCRDTAGQRPMASLPATAGLSNFGCRPPARLNGWEPARLRPAQRRFHRTPGGDACACFFNQKEFCEILKLG
ncbi:MAG: hypothetical protein R2788_05330 [Saprospiraceae bacterium]